MYNETLSRSENGNDAKTLSAIIHSFQEEHFCPPEVLARFKEFEDRTDITMDNLPNDLRWIVSLVLDRDDALIQSNKSQKSEQEMYDKLIIVKQENDSLQTANRESLEAGLKLSEICDKYYEDWKSLSASHFTSGSENASKIDETCDETENPMDDCKKSKTQNSEREALGDYFRKSLEATTNPTAVNTVGKGNGGRRTNKSNKEPSEATGNSLLEHIGEEDSWEPMCDGYETLSELAERICAETRESSDVNVTWSRCKPGHLNAVVANVEKKEAYYDLKGEPLPAGECPPKDLEMFGLSFRLIGYEATPQIEMIPATACVINHLYPKYKVSLKDMNAEDRAAAIVQLQELLGPDTYVDGFKSANAVVSARREQVSFLDESEETFDIDDELTHILSTEGADGEKTEREEWEGADGDEEAVMPLIPSAQEPEDNVEDPAPEEKEKKKEDSQEEAKKKEEQAQKKRDSERQRHEQKKQAKAEEKKAQNPNYKPATKRNKQRLETVVHPASEKKIIPLFAGKSYWSSSLVAYIIFLSLSMMLPIYRIECASASMLGGLNIPLSTLEALSILVFNRKLKYLLPYFYKTLNEQHYIHADETVIEVFLENMRKNTMKSYIWIYSTITSCSTQVRIYDYEPGRKGEFCKAMLASFVGVLITDAYQGYNMVNGVQHAFCFIHARRKIYDAAQNGSTRYARKLARRVLVLIDKLFEIEGQLQAAGYDPDTLAKMRQKEMGTILSVLKDTLIRMQKDQRIPSNGKLAKAVNYMLGHYEELTYFLKDGNVPMHNQVSEHAARRVALYRNNSLFCGSPMGAKAFAGILTVAETARANNLDVYKYLLFLLDNMRGDDFWKDEELMQSLLPWSERAQAECAAREPVKEPKIRLLGGQTAV